MERYCIVLLTTCRVLDFMFAVPAPAKAWFYRFMCADNTNRNRVRPYEPPVYLRRYCCRLYPFRLRYRHTVRHMTVWFRLFGFVSSGSPRRCLPVHSLRWFLRSFAISNRVLDERQRLPSRGFPTTTAVCASACLPPTTLPKLTLPLQVTMGTRDMEDAYQIRITNATGCRGTIPSCSTCLLRFVLVRDRDVCISWTDSTRFARALMQNHIGRIRAYYA